MCESIAREAVRISSLSEREWIGMQVTLNTTENERYRCGSCRVSDREKKACLEIKQTTVHRIGDMFFNTCPGNFVDVSVFGIIAMHKQWSAGNMPYPGSVSEQPAKIIEAFRVIDCFKHEKQEEAEKKARLRKRRGR